MSHCSLKATFFEGCVRQTSLDDEGVDRVLLYADQITGFEILWGNESYQRQEDGLPGRGLYYSTRPPAHAVQVLVGAVLFALRIHVQDLGLLVGAKVDNREIPTNLADVSDEV